MNIPPFTGSHTDDHQNVILFAGDRKFFPKILEITGRYNQIAMNEASDLSGLEINISGDDNVLYIGQGGKITGEINILGNAQIVQIGDNSLFAGVFLYASEGTNIRIGDDCMFAAGVDIRTSDAREVLGTASRQRVNRPGSVTIGDHVSVEKDVTISKGVTIAANCVVSAHSFVNQPFEQESVMIAGAPARVVRENVRWERPKLRLA